MTENRAESSSVGRMAWISIVAVVTFAVLPSFIETIGKTIDADAPVGSSSASAWSCRAWGGGCTSERYYYCSAYRCGWYFR